MDQNFFSPTELKDAQEAQPNFTQEQLQNAALASYQSALDPIQAEFDRYIDGLLNIAQGDLDRASKIIEENFQTALGTDDRARADFFKEVANQLENKVGRIVFDYQTGKNRLEDDIARETARTTENRDLALSRLAEDRQLAREGLLREAQNARREQGTALNRQGILAGTREGAQGLAGRETQDLESEINRRFDALARESGRAGEDITRESSRDLADIQRTGQRDLENLTTESRRLGQDAQFGRDRQLEQAQAEFEREQRRIEADRFAGQRQAQQQAREIALRNFV